MCPLSRRVDAESVGATARLLGVTLARGGAQAVADLAVKVEVVAAAPALRGGRRKVSSQVISEPRSFVFGTDTVRRETLSGVTLTRSSGSTRPSHPVA